MHHLNCWDIMLQRCCSTHIPPTGVPTHLETLQSVWGLQTKWLPAPGEDNYIKKILFRYIYLLFVAVIN